MRLREITEARRNPEMNPKHSFTNEMVRRLKDSDFIPNTNVQNAFVSFTSLEKLGINPSSEYYTPIGIYAYPLKYVYNEIGEKDTTWLPFAGEKPYANFFSLSDNATVLISTKFSLQMYDEYNDKLAAIFGDEEVNELVDASPKEAEVKTLFGRFWYTTYKLSKRHGKNAPSYWNGLMRKLGVDAVLDLGEGVIHDNEPTQIVIFNPRVVMDVERIKNVRTKEMHDFSTSFGDVARRGDAKEISKWIFDNRYEKKVLDKVPPKLLWIAIKDNPNILKYVDLPQEYQRKIVDEMPQHLSLFSRLSRETMEYALGKGMAEQLSRDPVFMALEWSRNMINDALGNNQ